MRPMLPLLPLLAAVADAAAPPANLTNCSSAALPFVCMLGSMVLTPAEVALADRLDRNISSGAIPLPTSGPSRCLHERVDDYFGEVAACPFYETQVPDGAWIPVKRRTMWQVPLGQPPSSGWPVAIIFQGSFAEPGLFWACSEHLPFGALYQALLVKNLLDAGYAVITPAAFLSGLTFWQTNLPPWDADKALWPTSGDAGLLKHIFAHVRSGDFGPLDAGNMHAAGISSGGYMTSRMAANYAADFRSLSVQSGSFWYCGGPLCARPAALPKGHPPTLFLHGDADPIVPRYTMEWYHDDLGRRNVTTAAVTQPGAVHQWIPQAPTAIPAWFDRFNPTPRVPGAGWCPGGSVATCERACPRDATAFEACADACVARCA